jgi:hypothetical protein
MHANERDIPTKYELAGADGKREVIDAENKGWSDSGHSKPAMGQRSELEAINKQWAELDARGTQKHQMP